jgi:DNA-binding IclR family transcriptional regulator
MGNISKYKVPNLERALLVIDLLAEHSEGLTQSEISSYLKLANSSIFRITMTLLEHGYLHRNVTKHFTLTGKFLTIGHKALHEDNLIVNALDLMRELRDKIKETILIGTIIDCEGVVLEQVLGAHPFKFSIDRGTRFSLHCSAPGKAILAFLPENECEAIISNMQFKKFNSKTIINSGLFRKELKEVRKVGYGVDRGEELTGIHCIGAPVFNKYGRPIAAIWTTGPSDRLEEDHFSEVGRELKLYAMAISKRLGYEQNKK